MTGVPSQGGFLLSRVHQLSGRLFNRMLVERGIPFNPGQGRILFALLQEEGVPIQTLSERTSLSPSTLTSMLDRMEADGLVERGRSPEDRRAVIVRLGKKARHLRDEYLAVSEEMTEIFYEGVAPEERGAFEATLGRLLQNLERQLGEGKG